MKRLLLPLKRWLAGKPKLRRRLVNAIYRLPGLDLRLRNLLNATEHAKSAPVADAMHLPEAACTVRSRLRARMPAR
ncbi:hypothetical protein [Dyella sp. RRB7]|uniref:hypothetical protein n=1 Tax=Dyella sp. RRB7 TaxID=2919502 RepID=UPI001FAAA0B7|nr:hypothetical protein [Dyella sp. RRB7]